MLTGHLGLFIAAFGAATLLPLQSEAVLVGLLLSEHYNLWLLLGIATLGNVLGSLVNWLLGRSVERFKERRWFPLSAQQLAKARRHYERWGHWTLLLSWVPIIGDPLTLVAGVMREPLWRFLLLVSLAKGIELGTLMRMSQVIEQELHCDPARIAVASGPNLALEIAREQPTAAVISSTSRETAEAVALRARNGYFRTFVNTDVIGTEFGGVLKNLIAVAIGIVDGVGYGENTKASIITRGLVEMTDFAVAYGAQPETLQGLAGLGDLIATCQSPLSRNNTAGRLLGQGYSYADVVKQMNQTAEGLASVAPVLQLAREAGVHMPIVEQVKMVLDGTMNPRDIAPHLTTDDDKPTGERTQHGQGGSGGALRRSLQRALDQFRHGRGSAARD